MISIELEKRMALYYAHMDAMEDWEIIIGDKLIDIIWANNGQLTDDELFIYAQQIIEQYIEERRNH